MSPSAYLESRMLCSGSIRTKVAKEPTATRKGAQFHMRYWVRVRVRVRPHLGAL